jgi:regulatory protein
MDGTDEPLGNAASERVRQRLRRVALGHLERYATSEAGLRRVLARRLRRWRAAEESAGPDEADTDDGRPAREAALVDEVIAHCRDLGLLDDAAFAETKVASGRRKGLSTRRIGATLAAKGVDRAAAEAALAADDTDDDIAALRFARRKRLGPFRTKPAPDPAAADRRDLAALCRNGHPLSAARRAIALDREAAEEALAGIVE